MRRVRYVVASSLDGYIAGPNGEFDWIPTDPEIDFNALFGEFDTFLMGRKTYEAMKGMMVGGKESKTFVFSRTLEQKDHRKVTIVSEGATSTIERLRAETGKDIWLFGGGELFRSLLDAGAVDSVEVAVIPVLLGSGIPLLPSPAKRAKLRLVTDKVYRTSGIVALRYDVVAA